MNYEDFLIRENKSVIPKDAYKPVIRCPYCKSVYITEQSCEECGRSLRYHPIGEAFGAKSYFGIKERYFESLGFFHKYFSRYEDKRAPHVKKLQRQLEKRFDDLILALYKNDLPEGSERRLYYIEVLFLVDDLLALGLKKDQLIDKIEKVFIESHQMLSSELMRIIAEQKEAQLNSFDSTLNLILQEKFLGFSLDFILKSTVITLTILFVSVVYYPFISLLIGK